MKSGRIVFLDIDGVLNGRQFLSRMRLQTHATDDPDSWKEALVDPVCVERLNRILQATGADVVLASSWRNVLELDEMQVLLEGKGFAGRITDRTPTIRGGCRRDEIEAWLETNEAALYVVLDDDLSCLGMRDRVVHTSSFRGGLTDEDVASAIAILGGAED